VSVEYGVEIYYLLLIRIPVDLPVPAQKLEDYYDVDFGTGTAKMLSMFCFLDLW
jgi:hypothetical protein